MPLRSVAMLERAGIMHGGCESLGRDEQERVSMRR